ncbi:hypothetical protein N5923_08725 [Erwiniaceae bacterium BAC15a-03b]|uniref:Uncharacterized protein n=1 Tax=Winslowiella arboricola TaxID=2978220 RepID=A0A9J6PLD8_9GAMM|nr:hypothetical protein [Winslowiella arboricola]MCU5771755.1 hypothetical protein [Winslowiella arboricola]MCU5777574.1 hypothetical protein [Winslowiella arboricola]
MLKGFQIIKGAVSAREIDIIYRYLAISKNIGHLNGNDDCDSAHMYYAIPYFEAMLSYYCSLIKEITNETVYPGYSFLWNYRENHAVPKHKDRAAVDYIISIGIHDQNEEDWPLIVESEVVNMRAGDIVVLDGKTFEHWREPCPYHNRLQLVLCYTRNQLLKFDKREHLGFDPVPEVITSPLKKQLGISDKYIKYLCVNDV